MGDDSASARGRARLFWRKRRKGPWWVRRRRPRRSPTFSREEKRTSAQCARGERGAFQLRRRHTPAARAKKATDDRELARTEVGADNAASSRVPTGRAEEARARRGASSRRGRCALTTSLSSPYSRDRGALKRPRRRIPGRSYFLIRIRGGARGSLIPPRRPSDLVLSDLA